MAAEVKNNISHLQIQTLEFIGSDNKIINILNWFKNIDIIEELNSMFTRGRMILSDVVNLREFYPMTGNEKVHIIWRSGKDSKTRDYTFRIVSIPRIETDTEGLSTMNTWDLVDDRYITLLKKRYTSSHIDKTMTQIITDFKQHFSLDVTLDVPSNLSSSTISYLNLHGSGIKMINDLRYYLVEPLCFYQKENDLIFSSYSQLFKQSTKYVLTSSAISTTTGDKTDVINSVSNIVKNDIFSVDELYADGSIGYKHNNFDLWNKTSSYDDNKLKDTYSSGLKFDLDDSDLKHIRHNKTSKYLEDYLLSDFVSCRLNYGLSDLFVGKLVELPMYGRTDSKQVSVYSGTHLISSVQHTFMEGFKYDQSITLIREKNKIV